MDCDILVSVETNIQNYFQKKTINQALYDNYKTKKTYIMFTITYFYLIVKTLRNICKILWEIINGCVGKEE